jgi:hypothetical protein
MEVKGTWMSATAVAVTVCFLLLAAGCFLLSFQNIGTESHFAANANR